MPPPPVLKKRYSLKGNNLVPLAIQFKDHQAQITHYARPKMNVTLDSMIGEEMITWFRDITGTSEKDISGKPITLKLLLHLTILYANDYGQPIGQELSGISVSK